MPTGAPSLAVHPALAELSGTLLASRYRLGRLLGAGEVRAVFEARDLHIDRTVAIKVLRPVFLDPDDFIQSELGWWHEHAKYAEALLEQLSRQLVDELAKVAYDLEVAKTIARRAGFPVEYLPVSQNALVFWSQIVEQANNGKIGLKALATEALVHFRYNSKIRDCHDRIDDVPALTGAKPGADRVVPASRVPGLGHFEGTSTPSAKTPIDTHFIKSFLREVRLVSKIDHPNVVEILDFGKTTGGLIYSVMKFLEGQNLETHLCTQPEQRLPWAQACNLLAQVAAGLGAANKCGVIHRDVRPANCLLTNGPDDQLLVKIVDFGMARVDDAALTQRLVGLGEGLGTPAYIAPEIVRTNSPANPCSDVYSLGVLAYRMLCGRVPFTGETLFEVLHHSCFDPVPPLRGHAPDVPPAVENFVLRLLAKHPDQRPQDMRAVRDTLRVLGRDTLGPTALVIPDSGMLVIEPPAPTGIIEVAKAFVPAPTHVRRISEPRRAHAETEVAATSTAAPPEQTRPRPPSPPRAPDRPAIGERGTASAKVLAPVPPPAPVPAPVPPPAPARAPSTTREAGIRPKWLAAVEPPSTNRSATTAPVRSPARPPAPSNPPIAMPTADASEAGGDAGQQRVAVLASRAIDGHRRRHRFVIAGLLSVVVLAGAAAGLHAVDDTEREPLHATGPELVESTMTRTEPAAEPVPAPRSSPDESHVATAPPPEPEPEPEPEPKSEPAPPRDDPELESEPLVVEPPTSRSASTKQTKAKPVAAESPTAEPPTAVEPWLNLLAGEPESLTRPVPTSTHSTEHDDETALKRAISSNCSKSMSGDSVSVKFHVTSNGQLLYEGLKVESRSAGAVPCARAQVENFPFDRSGAAQFFNFKVE
jgi:serine/threonine protein kinase